MKEKDILVEAELCFKINQSISTLLIRIPEEDRQELRNRVKGGAHTDFRKTVRREIDELEDQIKAELIASRKEAKAFINAQKKLARAYLTMMNVAKTFDEKCKILFFFINGLSLQREQINEYLKENPHLAAGFARNIGLMVGNLPKQWTGLVSHKALEAKREGVLAACISDSICQATLYNSPDAHNTLEHFVSMQNSGVLILVYALNYAIDEAAFKKLCNCLRQVHITTIDENNRLGRTNGPQAIRPMLHWKITYDMEDIELEEVGKEIVVLELEDCAPEGLLELINFQRTNHEF